MQLLVLLVVSIVQVVIFFINCACFSPFSPFTSVFIGHPQAALFARRDIASGEELTFSYGDASSCDRGRSGCTVGGAVAGELAGGAVELVDYGDLISKRGDREPRAEACDIKQDVGTTCTAALRPCRCGSALCSGFMPSQQT